MDDETFRDGEFSSDMTINDPGSSLNPVAFFPHSSGFILSGCTFNSNVTHNVHQAAPSIPSDFRRFPWGDIDLRHEIHLNSESPVVHRERSGGFVRRIYLARIEGREADTTVTVYEGDNSEEQWKHEISRYSQLRHPNILQIFGTASLPGMHAIIANDDLIPLRDFLKLYQDLPISTVYIYSFCETDFSDASVYMRSKFQDPLALYWGHCRFWIRGSTNRLCVELPTGSVEGAIFLNDIQSRSHDTKIHRNDLNQEGKLINLLELDQYQNLCQHLRKIRDFSIWGADAAFDIGAVICCPAGSQLERTATIAVLADAEIHPTGWFLATSSSVEEEITEDGWTRYGSDEVFGRQIRCGVNDLAEWQMECWLAQANYIFTQLRITCNHEDYVVINTFSFLLDVSHPVQDPPDGYLFVCPDDHLRTGLTTFRWPSCPAYWSLDPSGNGRLSEGEAERLGFPSIKIAVDVEGYYWDSSVYAGLHKFHQGKGFDSESQGIARHLQCPLYQLFSEPPFAHVDGEVSEEEEEGSVHSAGTPDETLPSQRQDLIPVHAQHASDEVNQASEMRRVDVLALPSLKSTGLLDASMSPELRGPLIGGRLTFTGRSSPNLSFPYESLDTPWDSHRRFNARGNFPVASPAQPPIHSGASGLTGPSSMSTFLTYPPPELPSMFSPTPPASISRHRSLLAHPNSPPWDRISAAEDSSVDTEARGNQSPMISHRTRAAEEIDSERPQKKSKPSFKSQSRRNQSGISIDLLLEDPR